MTTATVDQAISSGPVIGYRGGWPVSAIVPREGQVRAQAIGRIIYVPPMSVITFGVNSEIVVSIDGRAI